VTDGNTKSRDFLSAFEGWHIDKGACLEKEAERASVSGSGSAVEFRNGKRVPAPGEVVQRGSSRVAWTAGGERDHA
jgi:hypothetical protein